MANLKVLISGTKIDNKATDSTDELTIAETYIIGSAIRGEPQDQHSVVLDKNKVVEFVFDDDTVWFGDYETIDEVFPGTTAQLRGSDNKLGEKAFIIPTEIYVEEQNRSNAVAKAILKVVKIFIKKTALSPLVNKLASDLEEKQLNKRSGLFQLTREFEFKEMTFGLEEKYLLFLHGTASSTTGSFNELKGSST